MAMLLPHKYAFHNWIAGLRKPFIRGQEVYIVTPNMTHFQQPQRGE